MREIVLRPGLEFLRFCFYFLLLCSSLWESATYFCDLPLAQQRQHNCGVQALPDQNTVTITAEHNMDLLTTVFFKDNAHVSAHLQFWAYWPLRLNGRGFLEQKDLCMMSTRGCSYKHVRPRLAPVPIYSLSQWIKRWEPCPVPFRSGGNSQQNTFWRNQEAIRHIFDILPPLNRFVAELGYVR